VVVADREVKQDAPSRTAQPVAQARIIHNFRDQGFAAVQNLGNPWQMNGDRTADRVAQAIARIEAAAGRISAAADARHASTLSSTPAHDPELEARYAALQREAGEALQQLDRLLGTLETP